MPRHPPFALKNLTTKNHDKKAPPESEATRRGLSVLSRYPNRQAGRGRNCTRTPANNQNLPERRSRSFTRVQDARVHCVVLKKRATPTPRSDYRFSDLIRMRIQPPEPESPKCLVPQDPTTCTPTPSGPPPVPDPRRSRTEKRNPPKKATVNVPPMSATRTQSVRCDLAV
jgi:hypothetical protein